jgi:hypothetical protein
MRHNHSSVFVCASAAPRECRRGLVSFLGVLLAAQAALALDASRAQACGGCFHEAPSPTQVVPTVVTDHRMAFSISTAQTILWDQVVYSGNPAEFAWVLPVKQGARIELSQDAWFAALDASTQTVITGPVPKACPGPVPTDYEGGGGGGCGGFSSDTASSGFNAEGSGSSADAAAPPPVQVVSQSVVGPYDAVTVRSSQGEALGTWLRTNGYEVPQSIQPTIDAFTSEGFDFIALKLRPGEGVQAMQPVRVVTAGADLSLPLRMVAAGVGANVGIELFVLGEGRYHTQNFPDATIDFSQLAWDPYMSRSNYSQLAQAALSARSGTGWLTESAQLVPQFGAGLTPPLESTYLRTCQQQPPSPVGCPATDAGGSSEAGTDDGGCATATVACDDFELANAGIPIGDMWLTRLRAYLPSNALANDLVLEAAPSQEPVSNVHSTNTYTVPNYNPCPSSSASGATSTPASSHSGSCACRTAESPRTRYGEAVAMLAGFVGIALGARRRRPKW